MTKKHFTKLAIAEIQEIAKTKPYHAFALIAVFNDYAKNELGITLFKEQIINKGLTQMKNFYSPQGTLWLISKEDRKLKHMKKHKGCLVLEINKTIVHIQKQLIKYKITTKHFLTIK